MKTIILWNKITIGLCWIFGIYLSSGLWFEGSGRSILLLQTIPDNTDLLSLLCKRKMSWNTKIQSKLKINTFKTKKEFISNYIYRYIYIKKYAKINKLKNITDNWILKSLNSIKIISDSALKLTQVLLLGFTI